MDGSAFPLDPSNAEQAGDWDGEEGEYWARYHQEHERLLGVFDTVLLNSSGLRSDDRVLEVGCGTGATTRALAARAVDGSVCGVDLSGPMLQIAKEAADRDGIRNVEFVQGDAQVFPFEAGSFDLAVSRMGCMFFGDPATAFANIRRALRPGGRVALTVWRERAANEWIAAVDSALGEPVSEDATDPQSGYAPGPFSFADPALPRSFLERAGFVDVSVDPLDVLLTLGTVDDAQAFFETWIDEDLDHEARARTAATLRRMLAGNATPEGVLLPSAAWLVTARAPGKSESLQSDTSAIE
jgi:SAM-dependent methyltransferase